MDPYTSSVETCTPTFGQREAVRLDDVDRRAVYLSEGLGHGFCATDDATLSYLCSTAYNPTTEHAVHPLDPQLAIDWPGGSRAAGRLRCVSERYEAPMTRLNSDQSLGVSVSAYCHVRWFVSL